MLKADAKVFNFQINIGPRLSMLLPVSPQPLNNFAVEYGALECNVEIVDSLQDAVQVIYCRSRDIQVTRRYFSHLSQSRS